MPFVLFIQLGVHIASGILEVITRGLETDILEFIMLGRIPGTEIFIQFETLMALVVTAGCGLFLHFLLRDPNATR